MLLAVDIGNSNIVLGICDENKHWIKQLRIETSIRKISVKYEHNIRSFFLESGINIHQIKSTVLSSVVPDLNIVFKELLERLFPEKTLVLGPEVYKKLPLEISSPFEIGSDLVANAMAAYSKFKHTSIVVDFGTALTFTTIQGNKIAGVSITPGLKTAFHSLYNNTAQLPEVPLELPESVIGKNTTQAMQAGILWGYVGLVEYLLNHTKKELGEPCKLIATGGLSSILHPLADTFDEIDKNLTLEGLRIIREIIEN